MTRGCKFRLCALLSGVLVWHATAATNSYDLAYAPGPPDNPLKGFLPYAGSYSTFPCSMEWNYLPLRSLMIGPTNFNWAPMEALLNDIASRGHQTVFRIYLDYPTLTTGIPQYLLDAGLVTHSYTDYDNTLSVSPDYTNALLRQALTNFITALGVRYDGDPRIGFITVGLLGFWGEWHTYPHDDWFAPVSVQDNVLNAYEAAFHKTKFLLRQPFGTNPAGRRMGYHDDSFAFNTIDPPDWYFLGALKAAGETNKWRAQPIGGEVRPEVQSCLWDAASCAPAGQEFSNCVKQTHATWMLNHAAFDPGFIGVKKTNALAGARQLGYEIAVTNATIVDAHVGGPLAASITLRNLGVAPFYYDWPVQLCALDASNHTMQTWTTDWQISSLLPGTTNSTWNFTASHHLAPGQYKLLLRVQNPLTNGVSFRFANQAQDADQSGWLTLGQFSAVSGLSAPVLSGSVTAETFLLNISGTSTGTWTVEGSTNLNSWQAMLVTNTGATNWNFQGPAVTQQSSGFFRLRGTP